MTTRSHLSPLAFGLSAVVHGGIVAAALAMTGLFEPPKPIAVVAIEMVFETGTSGDAAASPAEDPSPASEHIESPANLQEAARASSSLQPSPIESEGDEAAAQETPSPSMGALTATRSKGVGVRTEVSPESEGRLRAEEPAPQVPVAETAAPAPKETAAPPKRDASPPKPRPPRESSQPTKPRPATDPARTEQPSSPPVRVSSPDGTGTSAQTARAIDDAKSGAAGGPTEPLVLRSGNTPPVYPEPARRRGWEGRVVLTVMVDITGLPTDVAVGTSSGFRMLDDAALAAVRHWRFEPARLAGVPVIASVNVPVTFRLTDVR